MGNQGIDNFSKGFIFQAAVNPVDDGFFQGCVPKAVGHVRVSPFFQKVLNQHNVLPVDCIHQGRVAVTVLLVDIRSPLDECINYGEGSFIGLVLLDLA